jgi:hypothetical protein
MRRDRRPDCVVLVDAKTVKDTYLLYDDPVPVCLLIIVPSFELNAGAARCTPIAEEEKHFVFRS